MDSEILIGDETTIGEEGPRKEQEKEQEQEEKREEQGEEENEEKKEGQEEEKEEEEEDNRVPITGPECLEPFQDGRGNLGLDFYCKFWKPELKPGERPKALVYIAHGLGEHCMRYDHVGKRLARDGYLVFAHDLPGHGRSGGERAYVDSFVRVYTEVSLLVDVVRFKLPGAPVFGIGHSLGGTILLRVAMGESSAFKGIVLISPAIITPVVNTFTKIASKFVAFFNNHAVIGKPLKPETLCRDPSVVKDYTDDELVYHGGLKARPVIIAMEMMETLRKKCDTVTLPFLLQHGSEDSVCDIAGSQLFYDKANSKDKKFTIYEGCYHQVHNEPEGNKERCLEEIAVWIEDRVGPPPDPKDCLIALTPSRKALWDNLPSKDPANTAEPFQCTDESSLVK